MVKFAVGIEHGSFQEEVSCVPGSNPLYGVVECHQTMGHLMFPDHFVIGTVSAGGALLRV